MTRGARAIVTGRRRQQSCESKEGNKRTVYELEVDDVGASLRNGTAKVKKAYRASAGNGSHCYGEADPRATEPAGGYSDKPPC
ncbi:MAG TPA: hypothetical protein VF070_47420 [Streptosporangiaceae bacterium]